MNTTKIREAFKHVQSFYPDVTQVFYGRDGRWLYCTDDLDAPMFSGVINIGLLEDAADTVPTFPNAYSFAEEA